jgi:hypothetical protein
MFSFLSRKQHVDIAVYLRRICDNTTPNNGMAPHLDRTENRYNRTVPVLVWPWADGGLDGAPIAGVTKDITDHGMGLIVSNPLSHREMCIGILSDETADATPWFFRARLVRGKSIGAGFWAFGVKVEEFLNKDNPHAVETLFVDAERLRPLYPVRSSTVVDSL